MTADNTPGAGANLADSPDRDARWQQSPDAPTSVSDALAGKYPRVTPASELTAANEFTRFLRRLGGRA